MEDADYDISPGDAFCNFADFGAFVIDQFDDAVGQLVAQPLRSAPGPDYLRPCPGPE